MELIINILKSVVFGIVQGITEWALSVQQDI